MLKLRLDWSITLTETDGSRTEPVFCTEDKNRCYLVSPSGFNTQILHFSRKSDKEILLCSLSQSKTLLGIQQKKPTVSSLTTR